VAADGRPLLVGDVHREPRYVEIAGATHTRSELAVPIRRGERVIGVLDMQSSKLDAFDERDLHTQQTIADQLSNAIENARLYEQTRRRAERLALINRISAAAGAVLDLETFWRPSAGRSPDLRGRRNLHRAVRRTGRRAGLPDPGERRDAGTASAGARGCGVGLPGGVRAKTADCKRVGRSTGISPFLVDRRPDDRGKNIVG